MSALASAAMTISAIFLIFVLTAWAMNSVAKPYQPGTAKTWKWGICLRLFGYGIALERIQPKPMGTVEKAYRFAGFRLVLLGRRA